MRTLTRTLKTRSVVNYGNGAIIEVGLTPPRVLKEKGFPKCDVCYIKIKQAKYPSAHYYLTPPELLDLAMISIELLAEKFEFKR
jgi:hypothetical protein